MLHSQSLFHENCNQLLQKGCTSNTPDGRQHIWKQKLVSILSPNEVSMSIGRQDLEPRNHWLWKFIHEADRIPRISKDIIASNDHCGPHPDTAEIVGLRPGIAISTKIAPPAIV